MALSILFLTTAFLFVLVLLFLVDVFFSFYLSVPSLSSSENSLKKFLIEVDLKKARSFYDLGSGNGRIIARVSKKYPNLKCTGIELNPLMYYWSVLRNYFSNGKTAYLRKDFFSVDLSDADAVYCFLFPGIMEKLEKKLEKEMKSGAVVVSSCFPMKRKKKLVI